MTKNSLYYIACVALLVIAAALRFYNLSENSLSYDEAMVATHASGTYAKLFNKTQYSNTSPILYHLVLHGVQKVNRSTFSVRLVPATASVLAVAVLLFLLPHAGTPRMAAFLSGLLATVSIEAIQHAQDVREYSVDALVAALLIVGLLAYLKKRKTILLCVSLLIAPLIQYGLVLFAVAVLATAMVMRREDETSHWLKQRIGLIPPSLFFLTGGIISYFTTLQYQIESQYNHVMNYLAQNYYQRIPGDTIISILDFVFSRTLQLLDYHLSAMVAAGALVAFLVAILILIKTTNQIGAITLLFLFSLLTASLAAVLQIYPLGSIRQCLYLGPIIFVAFGYTVHSIASRLPRPLAQAGLTAITGLIILAGATNIVAANSNKAIYLEEKKTREILAILEEQAREDDLVYISGYAVPIVKFYQGNEDRENYYYGKYCWFWTNKEKCQQELSNLYSLHSFDTGRIWVFLNLLAGNWYVYEGMNPWTQEGIERSIRMQIETWQTDLIVGGSGAYLFLLDEKTSPQIKKRQQILRERSKMYRQIVLSQEPVIRSNFDIYLYGNSLIYLKESCSWKEDTNPWIFLHFIPKNIDDLPEFRRPQGFENADFHFFEHGKRFDGKCMAIVPLPEYDIAELRTGQHTEHQGDLWDVRLQLQADKDAQTAATVLSEKTPLLDSTPWRDIISGKKPVIDSVFDVYLDENKLIYFRQPCAPADTRTNFFLNVYSEDTNNISNRKDGLIKTKIPFYFSMHGKRFDDQCVAVVPLPEYDSDIVRIKTGQQRPDRRKVWKGKFSLKQD